jgi:hypothetical protein
MSTFAVLATGPSMSQEVADYVRGKCKVVAVSDAYKLAPWADALVSNDRNWWDNNKAAQKFAGRKFASVALPGGVEALPRVGVFGGGINSGLQAMRAAKILGATKILLLGFDMQGTHYFGPHKHPLRNTTAKRFVKHIEQFNKWSGCQVINCTPRSALKRFPMSTIEQQLPMQPKIERDEPEHFTPGLISQRHRQLYRDYYAARSIARQPSRWLPRVEAMAKQVGAHTILDYGCGAGRGISTFSKYSVADYDPGVPGCTAEPSPADLVVSIHALEHVEPEYVDAVIEHMAALARKALFIVVSCEPSTKLLPNGSAWHSFVRSAGWWREKLSAFDPQPVIMDRAGAEYAALRLTSRPPVQIAEHQLQQSA